MKILFLCHKMPYPPVDGGAIASLNMITGFADLKHEVSVLAMGTPKHNTSLEQIPNDLKNNISWNQVYVDTKINPTIALINLLFSKKPYNAIRFINKAYSVKLAQILNIQFDIIQLEGLYLAPYIPEIRKVSKALISLRAHNVEWKIWQRLSHTEATFYKKYYYGILARRIKAMELNALSNVDLLIPITSKDQNELPMVSADRSFVSQTGILKQNISQEPVSNNKSLFHIGALDWIPNQEGIKWFIKHVWLKVQQQYPEWDFKIAGRNAPSNFEKDLNNYPVEYIGEVEDAKKFIDQNNIMIVPLLAGSGMRIKIIEGMARGKCIVTTPIGAEGIKVTNNKNIIIADNSDKMIESLIDLMNSPEKVKNIATNALEFIRYNFENSKLVEDLATFYQKILKG